LSEDFPALGGFRAGMPIAGYLLEAPVGAGGMAMVFRARDQRLDRLVALKILTPSLAGDQEFRRRFIAESQAAAAVDDPHIIPIYEAGEASGALFIAMRFVAGGDLRRVLSREGPLAPARAAEFISPVASALDAAHRAGLVHRDVKPGNILVDARAGRPDHVYLSDFGVSKGSVSLTGIGQYLGTPEYSAPEQARGGAVDGRADQYALACVAWELLTGSAPFKRDEQMAVLVAHLSEPPPSLAGRRPGLPALADQVLARALAKTPAERYRTCQDFSEALRGALGLPPYTSPAAAAVPDPAAAQDAADPGNQAGSRVSRAGVPMLAAAVGQPTGQVREPTGPTWQPDGLARGSHGPTTFAADTHAPTFPPGEPASRQHIRSGPGPGDRRARPSRRLRRGHLVVIALATGVVIAAAVVVPAKLTATATRSSVPPAGTPAASLTGHPAAPAATGEPAATRSSGPLTGTPAATLADPPSASAAAGSAPAAAGGPRLYDNIRFSSGVWQGWEPPAVPPGTATGVVANAYTGADVHVDVVTSSGLWDDIRYGNGTWQGWRQPPQPPGTILKLAEAPDASANLWLVASTTSGLYFSERAGSTGAWSQWTGIPAPGSGDVGDMSASVSAAGGLDYLQVAVVLTGGQLWHNIYSIGPGTWQGWAQPTQVPGGGASIAAAGMANGNAQFMVIGANGIAYHNIRYANGSWQGWRALAGQPPGLQRYPGTVSASVDSQGNAQFIITEHTDVSNDQWVAYHNIRYANGSWQGWNRLNTDGPRCAPAITLPTFTSSATIGVAHVDEICGNG